MSNIDWPSFTGTTLLIGALGLVGAVASDGFRRSSLADSLRPYVENVDGRSGISLSDCLDFAQRAGLPQHEVEKYYRRNENCPLITYSFEHLKTALKSYEGVR